MCDLEKQAVDIVDLPVDAMSRGEDYAVANERPSTLVQRHSILLRRDRHHPGELAELRFSVEVADDAEADAVGVAVTAPLVGDGTSASASANVRVNGVGTAVGTGTVIGTGVGVGALCFFAADDVFVGTAYVQIVLTLLLVNSVKVRRKS